MNRKKKLALNTTASLLKQIAGVVCGFILPRLFLTHYGSEVNGLISSIGQFLSLISLFDAGMGVVIEASLFQPLADKDRQGINKVLSSGQKFYMHFVLLLGIYVMAAAFIFPYIVIDKFDFFYTFTLVLSISISSFGQYCFGVTNSALLSADQRGYINLGAYAMTIIANTIISVLLIQLNCSIQLVKLVSSIVFLARPIFLAFYVRKKYEINWHEPYKIEPIKQKWNGFAQHFASLIVSNTDIVVLTLFSNLTNVSIYSVYFLVINSMKEIVNAATAGVRSLLGDMIARKEQSKLDAVFSSLEWTMHTAITLVFAITAILIVPFVRIYTYGVQDGDYHVPEFAVLLCIAYSIFCLRIPYFSVIMAAGHFKQTQKSAIIEAIINIVVSVAIVFKFGLIGVACGTLVAMFYRVIYLAWYLSKNILYRSVNIFAKLFLVDILIFAIMVFTTYKISLSGTSYLSWLLMACKIGIICSFECFALNLLFYPKEVINFGNSMLKRGRI